MNYVYPLKRISLFFSLVFIGFAGNLQAQSTCGSTIEDFNAVPVAEAGFTSNVQGTTIPGFTFAVSGNNGYLQRCNTTADVIYQIHTPTYQTALSQTSIGFGFDLSGAVQATEVIVFIEYTNSTTGNTGVAYVNTITPAYSGPGNSGTATICTSFPITSIAGFTAGDKYRLYFLVRAGSSSNANQCMVFDNFRTTGLVALIPLPVHFSDFLGRKQANSVVLIWSVAGEKDVLKYEIERSQNGKDFVKIGEVEAEEKTSYSFTDVQPVKGVNFYRVRNIDLDGNYKYTTIIRMNMGKTIVLKAFPQPAISDLTIEHGVVAGSGSVSLVNSNGQVVKRVTISGDVTQTVVSLAGLNSGVYVVRFDNGKGQVETLKVVKQ